MFPQKPVFCRIRIPKLIHVLDNDTFLPVKIRDPAFNQGNRNPLQPLPMGNDSIRTPFETGIHPILFDIYNIDTVRMQKTSELLQDLC